MTIITVEIDSDDGVPKNNGIYINNSESALLIASLRLIGFKEREGAITFVNFILNKNPEIQVCIHKNKATYYLIQNANSEMDIFINKNSLNKIIELII